VLWQAVDVTGEQGWNFCGMMLRAQSSRTASIRCALAKVDAALHPALGS
jgi:hypothetical protein